MKASICYSSLHCLINTPFWSEYNFQCVYNTYRCTCIFNRICQQHTPECQLCLHPSETIHNHLFECKALDIKSLLLLRPDKLNVCHCFLNNTALYTRKNLMQSLMEFEHCIFNFISYTISVFFTFSCLNSPAFFLCALLVIFSVSSSSSSAMPIITINRGLIVSHVHPPWTRFGTMSQLSCRQAVLMFSLWSA